MFERKETEIKALRSPSATILMDNSVMTANQTRNGRAVRHGEEMKSVHFHKILTSAYASVVVRNMSTCTSPGAIYVVNVWKRSVNSILDLKMLIRQCRRCTRAKNQVNKPNGENNGGDGCQHDVQYFRIIGDGSLTVEQQVCVNREKHSKQRLKLVLFWNYISL